MQDTLRNTVAGYNQRIKSLDQQIAAAKANIERLNKQLGDIAAARDHIAGALPPEPPKPVKPQAPKAGASAIRTDSSRGESAARATPAKPAP